VDPIHPIAPGPLPVVRPAVPPVERLPRVSREQDRPPRDSEKHARREPLPAPEGEDDEDGPRHIDVRA
jgi:hypothetical protein